MNKESQLLLSTSPSLNITYDDICRTQFHILGHHLISIIYGKEEEMLHFEYLNKAYVRETIYPSLIHSVVDMVLCTFAFRFKRI